jgi:hypothetical protein
MNGDRRIAWLRSQGYAKQSCFSGEQPLSARLGFRHKVAAARRFAGNENKRTAEAVQVFRLMLRATRYFTDYRLNVAAGSWRG